MNSTRHTQEQATRKSMAWIRKITASLPWGPGRRERNARRFRMMMERAYPGAAAMLGRIQLTETPYGNYVLFDGNLLATGFLSAKACDTATSVGDAVIGYISEKGSHGIDISGFRVDASEEDGHLVLKFTPCE